MTDTPDRRRQDVLPAQEASGAALRSLNADKTGQPFNFREGDSSLFQIVVSDLRVNLKRLGVPQMPDFKRAILTPDFSLLNDLSDLLIAYILGIESSFDTPTQCTLDGDDGDRGFMSKEMLLDQESNTTIWFTLYTDGSFGVSLEERVGFSEKFPGASERLLQWREEQGAERAITG